MTEREKAIDRTRKFLAMSRSTNPHEAARAAENAKKLIDKHQLSVAEIADSEEMKVSEQTIEGVDFSSNWRLSLLTTIATRYGCKALRYFEGNAKTTGAVVGPKNSVEVIDQLFRYFDNEVLKCRARDWQNELDTLEQANLTNHTAEEQKDPEFKSEWEVWLKGWVARFQDPFEESYYAGAVFVLQERILIGDLDVWEIWEERTKQDERKAAKSEEELREQAPLVRTDPRAIARKLATDHLKGRVVEKFTGGSGDVRNRRGLTLGKIAGATIDMPGARQDVESSKEKAG